MELLLQQLANGLVIGSTYAVVAIGFALAFTVLRVINFAHPDIFMVGMFAGLLPATQWPALGFGIALLAGAIGACLVGFALERTVIAPLRGRDVLMTLIGTLGVAIALQNGMALIAGLTPVAYPALLPRLLSSTSGPVALDAEADRQFRHLPRAACSRQPLRAAHLPMDGRRAPSPSGRTWRQALRRQRQPHLPVHHPARLDDGRRRRGIGRHALWLRVGLRRLSFYGLKGTSSACWWRETATSEGVMVVGLRDRRHRGAGYRRYLSSSLRDAAAFFV